MGNVNPTLVRLKVQRSNIENKALLKGTIGAVLREFLKKIGKSEAFDPKVDYDTAFIKMSQRVFRKSPIRIEQMDREDLILDALTKALESPLAQKFDPSRSTVQSGLGYLFQRRLINELAQFQKEKYRELQEREDTDFTKEEQQEYKRHQLQPKEETVEEKIQLKDLIKNLREFIQKKRFVPGKGNIRLVPLFNLLLKEKSNSEIARALKVSPAAITIDLEKLKVLILEFARREKDKDLLNLMTKYFKKTGSEAAKEKDWLVDVFKEYKRIKGEFKREPVGEVIKVKKSEFDDKMTDEYISNALLSGEKDPESLNSELNQYVEDLDLQDEILQDDGKIVGLEIVSDEIREKRQS